MPDPRLAVFVTGAHALEPEGGGVQRCTREYIAVARAAGFALEFAAYPFDRSWPARLRRTFAPRPYANLIPDGFAAACAEKVRSSGAGWIFINQTDSCVLLPALAELRAAGVRTALFSHGLNSTDYLHAARVRQDLLGGPPVSARDHRWLGRQLFAEMRHHEQCDAVFCLSPTDEQAEQWLGGRAVHWLPRLVENEALDWRPVAGRLGTVGTLEHEPNVEGILRFGRALEARGAGPVRLRLIGRPAAAGRRLAARFPFIDYLGGLDDAGFAAEARTWCAFVNPIFCYGRGCSTKLAVALNWRLPIASTRAGARGYAWDESVVPLCDAPEELAAAAAALADPAAAARGRAAVGALAEKSPRLAELAGRMRAALERVEK